MLVFVEVVRAESFTAAARVLDMPKSSVSRKIANLEGRLKAQLLHRTTRKVRLTDIGEDYYRSSLAIIAAVQAANQRVSEMGAEPCGRLRVTAPPTFAFVGHIVAEYLSRYPEVRVELVCAERHVDLVGEGFDVAIRAGRLEDSSLMARKLGSVSRLLVASASYLELRGVPRTPEQLGEHDTILFAGGREPSVWRLRSKRKELDVRPAPRLVVDDYELLLEAARRGAGIALLPDYVCRGALASGELLRVLPAWCAPEVPVHALYLKERQPTAKVSAFLDLLVERFASRLADAP